MNGVLPRLVDWARCDRKRDFYPALATLVSLVQNIFSSPYTCFEHWHKSQLFKIGFYENNFSYVMINA
jgi:hypothetical protein